MPGHDWRFWTFNCEVCFNIPAAKDNQGCALIPRSGDDLAGARKVRIPARCALDSRPEDSMLADMQETFWAVAHTKPRCEKKLVRHCERAGIESTLPCCKSPHRYRGKTVIFLKPLFPGYVFLKLTEPNRRVVMESDCVANLLKVTEQALFARQLQEILTALEAEVEVRLAPAIGKGVRVQIKSGPLRGLEGWVEDRQGPTTVLLRLDFIGQAAAVKVGAWELEPT